MGILSILDATGPIINKVLDFIPDPKQKMEAQQALLTSLAQWDSEQSAINQQEAASTSLFVAGWRPCMGWICDAAFAYKFLIQPILVFILIACGSDFDITLIPSLDWSEMSTVLFGMLGLGGLRTFEKMKGI